MDTSIVPLLLVAFLAAMAGTWMELRSSLEPPTCAECPHCRDRKARQRQEQLDAQRRQAELHALYARRWQLDEEEERQRRRHDN
jgi:hypothetical protein